MTVTIAAKPNPDDLLRILHRTRNRLEPGDYVCHVVGDVARFSSLADYTAANAIIQYIRIDLVKHAQGMYSHTLECVLPDDLAYRVTINRQLGHWCRLAWLDRMIHELETKGCLP